MRGHVMRNCRAQNYWAIVPVALLAAFFTAIAAAQTPGAFAGKTVTMYIGFGPGGGYDLWARVVARHIGAHLPGNPTVNAGESARRRQLSRRQLHLQRGAEGRHRDGG